MKVLQIIFWWLLFFCSAIGQPLKSIIEIEENQSTNFYSIESINDTLIVNGIIRNLETNKQHVFFATLDTIGTIINYSKIPVNEISISLFENNNFIVRNNKILVCSTASQNSIIFEYDYRSNNLSTLDTINFVDLNFLPMNFLPGTLDDEYFFCGAFLNELNPDFGIVKSHLDTLEFYRDFTLFDPNIAEVLFKRNESYFAFGNYNLGATNSVQLVEFDSNLNIISQKIDLNSPAPFSVIEDAIMLDSNEVIFTAINPNVVNTEPIEVIRIPVVASFNNDINWTFINESDLGVNDVISHWYSINSLRNENKVVVGSKYEEDSLIRNSSALMGVLDKNGNKLFVEEFKFFEENNRANIFRDVTTIGNNIFAVGNTFRFDDFIGQGIFLKYQIQDSLISSLDSELLVESFKIYPNPSNDFIFIGMDEFDEIDVKILNSEGLIVKDLVMMDIKQIDISNLKSGCYYMILVLDNKDYISRKFVINK